MAMTLPPLPPAITDYLTKLLADLATMKARRAGLDNKHTPTDSYVVCAEETLYSVRSTKGRLDVVVHSRTPQRFSESTARKIAAEFSAWNGRGLIAWEVKTEAAYLDEAIGFITRMFKEGFNITL